MGAMMSYTAQAVLGRPRIRTGRLTPFQCRVLRLLHTGRGPTDIAAELGKTTSGITTELSRIRLRLGADNNIVLALMVERGHVRELNV